MPIPPQTSQESTVVHIHPSQHPRVLEQSLIESLRSRRMNHKFHYETPRQSLAWLRLHEALSPARTDPDCDRLYDTAFASVAAMLGDCREIEIVSLGCGGGQKDARLLSELERSLPESLLSYVPADVSVSLALTAREAALASGLHSCCINPVVIDLDHARDWQAALGSVTSSKPHRVVCFFGMLPNFAPSLAMLRLQQFLRPGDLLLLSANLAPGPDYSAGVHQVLPLYDNALTRAWLVTVLLDLGMEAGDGEMSFRIAPCPDSSGLLRIECAVRVLRPFELTCAGRTFQYSAGEDFDLFFSYRHTPDRLSAQLVRNGMEMLASWANQSGEEGVFLCRRIAD